MNATRDSAVFWSRQRVVVTGATGFLGSHLVARIRRFAPKELRTISHTSYDLRSFEACKAAVSGADIVIHAAGYVGGIGLNEKFPATLFDDNILMGVYITKASHEAKVKKLVHIGTVCSYPKYAPAPFSESSFWNGYPEETNAAYGIAKKAILVQAEAYARQYGDRIAYVVPVNLYGPSDSYHPLYAHVIPSLIRKLSDAKKRGAKRVTLWGTGLATREFLYVEDAARAILLAAEKIDAPVPVNIGSGKEYSIRDVSYQIAKLVSYEGEIVFDGKHSDGQPRRLLDTRRAQTLLGFTAKTPFPVGLRKTVLWYLARYP